MRSDSRAQRHHVDQQRLRSQEDRGRTMVTNRGHALGFRTGRPHAGALADMVADVVAMVAVARIVFECRPTVKHLPTRSPPTPRPWLRFRRQDPKIEITGEPSATTQSTTVRLFVGKPQKWVR